MPSGIPQNTAQVFFSKPLSSGIFLSAYQMTSWKTGWLGDAQWLQKDGILNKLQLSNFKAEQSGGISIAAGVLVQGLKPGGLSSSPAPQPDASIPQHVRCALLSQGHCM